MPYSANNYPDMIKRLTKKEKEIWIAAYNAAVEDYDKDKTTAKTKEEYGYKVAWAAVKKYQEKNEVSSMSISETLKQIDEAGKRNSVADEIKIKEILKLATELLDAIVIPTEASESIQGSQEERRDKLSNALRRTLVGDRYYIEAVFDDMVIFCLWGDSAVGNKYYQAGYNISPINNEDYIISDIREVNLVTIIQVVNERIIRLQTQTIVESKQDKPSNKKNENRKPHQINEIITLKDYEILEEQRDVKGKTVFLKIRVPVAQIADTVNENKRKYPAAVLKESICQQQKLAEMNSLTMYDTHPKNNSGTVASIIGKISQLSFSDETKTVSLDEVVFIATSTGIDCMEVIRAGIPLQVSQRGEGYSHIENIGGQPIEIVESQQVFGYDLLPPGAASVQDKGNKVEILESKKEIVKMEVTQVQLDEMMQKVASDTVKAVMTERQKDFDELKTLQEEIKAEKAVESQIKTNEAAVKVRIANDSFRFSRFNEHQQKVILEGLDYSGTTEAVNARLDERIKMMDTSIAAVRLEERGIRRGTSGSSLIVEVGASAMPGQERIAKLSEATKNLLQMDEAIKTSARTTAHIKAVLENFARINERALLNEADTMGAGNLPTVTQYSAVVIEQAFQLITSLDLCDIGTMNSSPIDVFLENYSENPKANINALKVVQGGTMAKAALSLAKFPLYSEVLKLRVGLYEEALVAAKSANNYDIEARSILSLVKDFSRRKDMFNYGLMLAKSDCYDVGKVTTSETLSQVGTTTKWYGIHGGLNYLLNPTDAVARANRHHMWVKNEFIKKFDSNNNLASTYLALAGTDATSILQAVIVVDSSATPKTLVYGYLQADDTVRVAENDLTSALADYYVLYPDGAIVISDSPVTSGLTGPYKAKYTYTKNARVWMATPPAGVSFENHLKELHMLTGQAKTQLVGSRYWIANFLAASTSTADMLSNSILYQQAGSNPANAIGSDGWIERFAGFVPTKSVIIPDDRLIVGVKGAIAVRSHVPYRIEGPIRTVGIAESEYQALETEGTDCFIASKLATVGIGQ
ncbi:MAG: ChaB family protein [bacterium]|nr:ChaB family protein [bacterium]